MLSQKGFIKVGKCGLPFPNHIPANNLLEWLNLNRTIEYVIIKYQSIYRQIWQRQYNIKYKWCSLCLSTNWTSDIFTCRFACAIIVITLSLLIHLWCWCSVKLVLSDPHLKWTYYCKCTLKHCSIFSVKLTCNYM